jgi:hypothetical protein
MLEQDIQGLNGQTGRLPRLAGLPMWQLITVFALAFMNASWGNVAFRIAGVVKQNSAQSASIVYLASGIFITYVLMVALSALRFREDYKRVVGGIWLLILIAILPAIIYPQFQALYYLKFNRYISRIFQLNFLFTSEFLSSLMVIYFWQRGLKLSNHWVGPLSVGRSIRNSTILMIILGLIATNIGYVVPVPEIFLLLFSGLLAMGGARISSIGFIKGGSFIPFSRAFFVVFSLSAAALIAVSLALTSAFEGPISVALKRIFMVIGIVSSWIVVVVFGPVFIIILELVERFLAWLKPFAATVDEEILPALTEVQAMVQAAAEDTQPFPFADRVNELLSVVLPILGILLALLVGYYALKRTRATRLWWNPDDEQQGSIVGSLPDLLKAFMHGGVRSGFEALSQLLPISRVIAAARIRQIYRQLLRESANLGKPREQAETPLEFLPDLQIVFPGCQAELLLITRAYLRVRYGEYPESRGEVEDVEQAWKDVRRQGVLLVEDN